MSDLKSNPLFPMFNVCAMMMARKVWPQGYDLSDTNAPDSLTRLKAEYAARGRITIFSGGCSNTIFDDAGTNQDFRAWHDYCHIEMNADFSFEGERAAFNLQASHIHNHWGSVDTGRALIQVLEAEVIGQARYWRLYKKYVGNQRGFCLAYMADPASALAREW